MDAVGGKRNAWDYGQKKPHLIRRGLVTERMLITLLSRHALHGDDRFQSGDAYGYG